MEDFRLISVKSTGHGKINENNPTRYPLISKGWQGAVFKLSDSQCVKIFAEEKTAAIEVAAYKKINSSPIIPRLYETGPNFIVMEFIKGLTVQKYLMQKNDISESITHRILYILDEMKHLQFTMIDFELDNAIIAENNTIKIIDLVNAFRVKHPKPVYLFRDLQHLKLLHKFMKEIKKANPSIYQYWEDTMLEEMGL